jgi:hypothetical protein
MDHEQIRTVVESLMIPIALLALNILADLKKSVQELNIKMAVVISRLDTHESRIVKLEDK